ncbi:MAG: hypothetical protein IJF90_10565, partial [Synergistaceae bacterium]|nr:hypothetical protein [Synergistaceae bacterium]
AGGSLGRGLADVVLHAGRKSLEAAGDWAGTTLEIAGRKIEEAGKFIGGSTKRNKQQRGGKEWRA